MSSELHQKTLTALLRSTSGRSAHHRALVARTYELVDAREAAREKRTRVHELNDEVWAALIQEAGVEGAPDVVVSRFFDLSEAVGNENEERYPVFFK